MIEKLSVSASVNAYVHNSYKNELSEIRGRESKRVIILTSLIERVWLRELLEPENSSKTVIKLSNKIVCYFSAFYSKSHTHTQQSLLLVNYVYNINCFI